MVLEIIPTILGMVSVVAVDMEIMAMMIMAPVVDCHQVLVTEMLVSDDKAVGKCDVEQSIKIIIVININIINKQLKIDSLKKN